MKTGTAQFKLYLIAGNPFATPKLLCALACHVSEEIRARAAEHPRLPREELLALCVDDSPIVRMAVGENPATPLAILELLAEDPQVEVRYSLAENAHTPMSVLVLLTRDSHPYIAERARTTLSRILEEARMRAREWMSKCA